jgi:guanyl-specific ribonuclease Sa
MVTAVLVSAMMTAVTVSSWMTAVAVSAWMTAVTVSAWMTVVAVSAWMTAVAVQMHNNTVSSGVESLNMANLPARETPFAESLEVLAHAEKTRYDKNRARALECDTYLPPKLQAELLDMRTRGGRITRVVFLNGEKSVADVASLTHPTLLYRVNLNAPPGSIGACSCGEPLITGKPDVHMVKAADVGGVINIAEKYGKNDLTSTWQAGYANELKIPSHADIDAEFAEYDPYLCYPPILRRGRGRPSKKRKRGCLSAGHGKKKRKFRCSNCHQFGHSKRRCKNITIALTAFPSIANKT